MKKEYHNKSLELAHFSIADSPDKTNALSVPVVSAYLNKPLESVGQLTQEQVDFATRGLKKGEKVVAAHIDNGPIPIGFVSYSLFERGNHDFYDMLDTIAQDYSRNAQKLLSHVDGTFISREIVVVPEWNGNGLSRRLLTEAQRPLPYNLVTNVGEINDPYSAYQWLKMPGASAWSGVLLRPDTKISRSSCVILEAADAMGKAFVATEYPHKLATYLNGTLVSDEFDQAPQTPQKVLSPVLEQAKGKLAERQQQAQGKDIYSGIAVSFKRRDRRS